MGELLLLLLIRALWSISKKSIVKEGGKGTKLVLRRVPRSTSYAARLGRREAQGDRVPQDWGW